MDECRASELRVAIVGCGRMGRERARCARALNARVQFVFDVDGARARELAAEHDAAVVEHPDQFFTAAIDAVFVCTAPGHRGQIEMSCMDHWTPFMVEKPLGTSAAQCARLMDRLRVEPLLTAVGYMNRYRSTVQFARAIVRQANVIGAAAHWVCGRYRVPWWQEERLSGGPHNEQATHLFDLSRFLLGEVAQVEGITASPSRVSCTLRFESGAVGTTLYSCDARNKDIGFRIFTEEGTLLLSGWDFRVVENSITNMLPEYQPEDVFLLETRAFLEAVSTGNRNLVQCDFADAFRTQQLMDAARESSAGRSAGTPAEQARWSMHAGA